jgi:hypothetical protein
VLGRVILTAKKLYLNKIINNSNNKIKTTWKVKKNLTGNNLISTNVTCLNINGNSTQNHQKIVDSFNNFFLDTHNATRKHTNKDAEIDKRHMDYLYTSFQKPFHKLILNRINCKEVEEVIRTIKRKPASGYDGINIKLIKASAIFMSPLLAYIINKSLFTGIFPKRLKYSEIIYKKDTRLICQTIDL